MGTIGDVRKSGSMPGSGSLPGSGSMPGSGSLPGRNIAVPANEQHLERIGALAVRLTSLTGDLEDAFERHHEQIALQRQRRRVLVTRCVQGFGVLSGVTALLVPWLTGGSVVRSNSFTFMLCVGVVCFVVGVIAEEYVAWKSGELLEPDPGLIPEVIESAGGVGAHDGVILYVNIPGVRALVEEFLDHCGVDDDDVSIIRTLLIDGSDLSLGQLVATAKSLRD